MGQIVNTLISRFDGGLVEDKRSGWIGSIKNGFTTNKFSLTKHFDVFTYPKKLVPYHKTLNTGEDKTYKIVKFAQDTSTYYGQLYGFGVVSGTNRIKVFKWDGDSWEVCANGEGGAGFPTRNTDVFFHYKGYIYMFGNGDELSRFDTTEVAAFADTYQSITYSTVAQPVHHPADDCAYFFANNKVYRLDGTTWDGLVLTLPDNLKIVSACPYGNYLAIGCVVLSANYRESIVYLWDRDSSLVTLTERIHFGKGELKHLANLNNKLIGVISFYPDNLSGYGYGLGKGKIIVKQASGNFAVTLNELTLDETLTSDLMTATNVVKENKLYFPAGPKLKGDTRLGIWAVDDNGRIALDFIEEKATSYQGIFLMGNTWFIAHSGNGSFGVSDITATYSITLASIYESLIFNAGDSDLTKKLIGVAVMFEKLPAAGQVVLKYRIDGVTSWTTIYTYTTDSGISHGAVNIESSGANLSEYKELEIRIESTGGAIITGLKFKSEIMDKQLF